jgi:hypothetical protein
MESQLASARVLLMAAAVPMAVFLCLRAAGVEVGLALGGEFASAPSSDIQVVADFTGSATSADDLFDRRAGTRASVTRGGTTPKPETTNPGAKGAGSGGGGGQNNNGGGTKPLPPPPPGLLQSARDALKPVTDATGTGPVVNDVTGTVEGTIEDLTGSLPELPVPS